VGGRWGRSDKGTAQASVQQSEIHSRRPERYHHVGEQRIDSEEFLEQLRAEHQVLKWEPLEPTISRRPTTSDQVRSRSALEYLHSHWVLPDSFEPADAGRGMRGRIIGLFGRLTFRVLGRYLSSERDLLAHMVRVNEALERRCDELTLRCQQVEQDMVDRQVAEAANQAKLAAWLHLEPPISSTGSAGGSGEPVAAQRRDSDAGRSGRDAQPAR